MQIAPRTILADLSDPYYSDVITAGMREQVAAWLDDATCTREQATKMMNWLFAHAKFQNIPPETSVREWVTMVKAAGMVPEGHQLVITEKGILLVA